jgi:glycosyltransferase involved in cell wall biosynthesis
VVTTNANGFSEIIDPRIHGGIVTPGDVPALTQELEFWRHADRQKTAEVCRARASEYSLERNTHATIAALEEARAV